jgi:uracil-DNA glycosylase family 4
MPMLRKPQGCAQCPLEHIGVGFAPPVGPVSSPFAWIGESLGDAEAYTGLPFQGPAGQILNKLLRRVGLDRDAQRIHNVISCKPPGNELTNRPYEAAAIAQCRQYLDPVLRETHKVFIALGVQPTRALLDLPK